MSAAVADVPPSSAISPRFCASRLSSILTSPPSFTFTDITPTDDTTRSNSGSAAGRACTRWSPPPREWSAPASSRREHRADDLRRDRLEEVGAAASAVADVVAHQVGDHRRVARVVLGIPASTLPPCRRRRRPPSCRSRRRAGPRARRATREAEADDHVGRRRRRHRREEPARQHEQRRQPSAEPHHQQPADAAAQRDVDRLLVRAQRGGGGTDVGAHRHQPT